MKEDTKKKKTNKKVTAKKSTTKKTPKTKVKVVKETVKVDVKKEKKTNILKIIGSKLKVVGKFIYDKILNNPKLIILSLIV